MKNIFTSLIVFIASITLSFSQEKTTANFGPKELNWYNLDPNTDKLMGASVNKAYKELLINKTVKKTIIIAIIDGGVDINHEDLKGKIWINEKEIPNNKIDDDKNGYVDDINGWNFIGNTKGENINYENLEYTRVYKTGPQDKDYERAKKLYDQELANRIKEKESIAKFEEKYNAAKAVIKEYTGVDVKRLDDLKNVTSENTMVTDAATFLKGRYNAGFTESSLARRKKRNSDFLDKYLNTNFNPREIIGDNPNDINDNNYGNPDVIGPRASHGTCLAGIIAATRNNGIGIDGVATNVKIMVLRTTPNGDERDKDVALAIKYAVDNGAQIINMSFGKAFSPQQAFVENAIKLAEQKNVLLIHAAGNEGENIDLYTHYPSDIYSDKTEPNNFINIGASGKEDNKSIASIFSNYGQLHVDIFAPGEDIIATDTNNTYSMHSGTSEAAPVVTGIAALILSYYPELTPKELITILLESSTNLKKQKVQIPDLKNDERETVKFGDLSKSGGIVNAYEALKAADKYYNLKAK